MNDRKYRHRGYQESSSEERRPRGPRPDALGRSEGAPRGRGIDTDKAVVFACKSCGEKQRDLEDIRVDSTCPRCGADLHSCAQCLSFDTSAQFECIQPIPERIPNKKLRNSCPLFSPAKSFDLTGTRATTATPDDARAAFDRLFKK
ncbi:MAG: hypothetical protein ABJC28_07880 [Acidobacteriota bacterium]